MSHRLVLIATLLALVTVSACTSSHGAPKRTPTVTATVPTVSTVVTAALPPPTTSAAPAPTTSSTPRPTPTSTAPTTPARSPSPTPPPAAAPAFTTTCASLTVRVIPGGAERGAEIAALQYVNGGSGPCSISGFPTAVLLRGGAVVGRPSAPDGARVTARTLAPGDVAESLLTDFSTCQAPLSDQVRVTVPVRGGRAGAPVVAAARLRACTLRVAPVGPPA